MTLRSDDGKILEVKEGVILDNDGNLIAETETSSSRSIPKFKTDFRFVRSGGMFPVLIALPIGLLIGFMTLLIGLFSMTLLLIRAWVLKRTLSNTKT